MDAKHVRAYVERDWAAVEARKQAHWAREHAERGPEATLAASAALFEHMRLVRPDWPTAQERRADLEHHLALKRAIDRAASVFAGLPAR